MNNLTRIRYTTENFSALQGLKVVPFALVPLLLGLAEMVGATNRLYLALNFMGVLLIIGAYFLIDKYYKQRYGVVQRSRRSRIQSGLMGFIGFNIYGAMRESDSLQNVAVSLIALAISGMALYAYFQSDGLRKYLLGIAILPLPLVVAPLFGLNIIELQNGRPILLFIFGTILLIGGVLDHLTLDKLMSPVEETIE